MTDHGALTAQTALFVPGDRPDRVGKALTTAADVVIIDLEDAVAVRAKDVARREVAGLLLELSAEDFSSKDGQDTRGGQLQRTVVRVNSPLTDAGRADLKALADVAASLSRMPALMIPKCEATGPAAGPLDDLPSALEDAVVVALVETPTAATDLRSIAAHPRVGRLAVGAVDLSAALGCTPDSVTIHSVRAATVLASAVSEIPAPLDSPCVNFTDPSLVEGAARAAARDGFAGMLCIHPRQLEHVSAAFAPSQDELDWAHRVVAAGDGAGTVDGQMVDRPVVLRATRLLKAAEHAWTTRR